MPHSSVFELSRSVPSRPPLTVRNERQRGFLQVQMQELLLRKVVPKLDLRQRRGLPSVSCEFPCPRRCDIGLNDDQQAEGYDADVDKGGWEWETDARFTGLRAAKFRSGGGLDRSMLIASAQK